MRIILISFFLVLSSTLASTCEETFSELYTSSYRSGCCYENIWNFTQKLTERKMDLSHAKVILLFVPHETLVALNTREGWKEWKFHLVLENEGVIYDFDYTNEPDPVDFGSYFESMFTTKSQNWGLDKQSQKIRVYEMQAEDYFHRFQSADLGPPLIDHKALHAEAQNKTSVALPEYLKSKLNRSPNDGFWIPFTSPSL